MAIPLLMVEQQGATMCGLPPFLHILGLLFTTALSTTFMGLNQRTHQEPEHPILHAIFCLEVAAIYILYMIISRIAKMALDCIERRSSVALSPYERVMEHYMEWGEEEDEAEQHEVNTDNNERPHEISSSNSSTALLLPQQQQQQQQQAAMSILFARGIHREALISSMYLGGSGCFLALPALSFWNISQTCAFLLSLTAIAFFGEHTKLVEFAPNQDKAKVLREMQYSRWTLYLSTTGFILSLFIEANKAEFAFLLFGLPLTSKNDTHPSPSAATTTPSNGLFDSGSIIMLILAFVSPLLLRLSLPHAVVRRTSLMSPSQVLEAALPVACLHAILVLGWYGGTTPPMGGIDLTTKFLPLFIPMLIICPFCQVVILAFILRGFRQRQTMPTVVLLAFTAFIMQQIFSSRMTEKWDWSLFVLGLCVLASSFTVVFTKYQATAQDPKITLSNNSMKERKTRARDDTQQLESNHDDEEDEATLVLNDIAAQSPDA
jgi:hypothetical protein